MKRATVCIVLFLLLGTITNVGVAWGRALFWPGATDYNPDFVEPFFYHHHNGNEYRWAFTVERRLGMIEILSFSMSVPPDWIDTKHDRNVTRDDLVKWGYIYESGMTDSAYESLPCQDLGYGWPAPALVERHMYLKSMRWSVVTPVPTPATHYYTVEVPTFLQKLGPGRTLPIRILPIGFVINVLTHAVLWFALLRGVSTARRIVRHRKGLCTKCRYDLRHADHAVCPECGTPT